MCSRGKHWEVADPRKVPLDTEVAWAAGFLEGDGYFGWNRTTLEVSAVQKDSWPLELLRIYFGGSLGMVRRQGVNARSYYRWRVSGQRARDVIEAVRPYMSPRRLAKVDAR